MTRQNPRKYSQRITKHAYAQQKKKRKEKRKWSRYRTDEENISRPSRVGYFQTVKRHLCSDLGIADGHLNLAYFGINRWMVLG